MSHGFNVWRSWHIENFAIHMFKWEGWWTCKKTFGIWKYWKIVIYLIKNCPPKQTMTLLLWWLFLMWLQCLKDPRFMGTILNHHFHLNTSKKSSLCVLKWTFIHVAKYFAHQQGIFYHITKSESMWHKNIRWCGMESAIKIHCYSFEPVHPLTFSSFDARLLTSLLV